MKIIRALDIYKAHGYGDISIKVVRICDDAVIKPLSIIYKSSIENGIYPDTSKNIYCPSSQERRKTNYRLLLPI